MPQIIEPVFDFSGQRLEEFFELFRNLAEPSGEVTPQSRNGFRKEIVKELDNYVPFLNYEDNTVSHQADCETDQCTDTSSYRTSTSTDDSTDTSTSRRSTSTDKRRTQPVNTVFDSVINASDVCRNTSDNTADTSTQSRTSRRCSTETQVCCRRGESCSNSTSAESRGNPASNRLADESTADCDETTAAKNLSEVHSVEFVLNSVNDTSRFQCDTSNGKAQTDGECQTITQPSFLQSQQTLNASENALRNLPRCETESNSTHSSEDSAKSCVEELAPCVNVLSKTEPFLHFSEDFFDLAVYSVTEEVISRKLETETTSTAASTSTAGRIFGRRNDVQLVNAEESVFQLLRLVGCVTETVCNVTDTASGTTDTAIINFRQSKSEKACDCVSHQTDSLCESNRIRQHSVQNRDKDVTQRTSALCNLCFQDTKLVSRSFQCTSHIALSGSDLCHDSVVSQFRFLSLCHEVDIFLNAEVKSFLLQSRHRQVETKPTERFKLAGDTRL